MKSKSPPKSLMEGEKIEKDTRPVRCFICKRKMYYMEHSKYEPEFQIYDDTHHFKGYVHKRCLK